MKPEHLEKLLAVGTALQGGLARVRRVREWVARNSVLVAAMLVLLLAFVVRRWLARRSAADAGAARMLHTATTEVCLCCSTCVCSGPALFRSRADGLLLFFPAQLDGMDATWS